MTQLLGRPVAVTGTNFGPVASIQRILEVKAGQSALNGLFQADCIHVEVVEDQLAEKHKSTGSSAGGLFLEDLLIQERELLNDVVPVFPSRITTLRPALDLKELVEGLI